jgi:hypothetical protein
VVIVRAGQQVACDFDAANPGQRMTHCHNLYHVPQGGMMARPSYHTWMRFLIFGEYGVTVVANRPDMLLTAPRGAHQPWAVRQRNASHARPFRTSIRSLVR